MKWSGECVIVDNVVVRDRFICCQHMPELVGDPSFSNSPSSIEDPMSIYWAGAIPGRVQKYFMTRVLKPGGKCV